MVVVGTRVISNTAFSLLSLEPNEWGNKTQELGKWGYSVHFVIGTSKERILLGKSSPVAHESSITLIFPVVGRTCQQQPWTILPSEQCGPCPLTKSCSSEQSIRLLPWWQLGNSRGIKISLTLLIRVRKGDGIKQAFTQEPKPWIFLSRPYPRVSCVSVLPNGINSYQRPLRVDVANCLQDLPIVWGLHTFWRVWKGTTINWALR